MIYLETAHVRFLWKNVLLASGLGKFLGADGILCPVSQLFWVMFEADVATSVRTIAAMLNVYYALPRAFPGASFHY
ncbi:hypothetical protein M413DRAFT_442294 [Hebeloma cylindrosporum]|uniref:Uncharacterized protein n=1 Tax=Hebeloma cylindrosporum TaxID=76867 RepID=A0A0C2Y741_HEBCY|nr:hypothetical protein M413DRAFT_442294 [Hebeloma cylindrosporum h7]